MASEDSSSARGSSSGGSAAGSPRSSPAARTHYEVLGVASSAAHADVRQAYYRAARRWHPDRFTGGSPSEADRAETQMRRVNEAWEILGTTDRRAAYDRQLQAMSTGRRATTSGFTNDDGVIRIDPRLLDPDVLHARRHAQADEISNRSSAILRVAPVLVTLGLLAAIFVFTAYARSGRGEAPPTTFPGPSLGAGIESGVCVSVIGGPSLLARPCDANADGRVIGARQPDGTCPLGTLREVELTNSAVACLGPVG
ncbi:MAG: J domain-containing protein [Acidimicrobiales bacterium]